VPMRNTDLFVVMLKDFTASVVLSVKCFPFYDKSVKCASRKNPINRHIFDA